MLRGIIKCVVIGFLSIMIIISSYVPLINATQYQTQQNQINQVYDISLNWEQLLGSKQWTRVELWDEFATHCFLTFKANAGLDVSIPANLQLSYPSVLEPGQQFNLETELNLAENKEITFSFEFFIGIDLDLPLPTLIPGIGFTDDFNEVYGGAWEFTFDLNSNTVQRVLNTISLGENEVIQTVSNYFGVNEFISIRNIDLNTHNLGRLAFAEIKISFLEAILAAAKAITSLAPPLTALIEALDWLLTNVIKVDTGLTLSPSLNAEIVSPISSDSRLIFNTNSIVFSEDSSTKTTFSTVNSLSKESVDSNQIFLNYGPLEYRLSFLTDWSYYMDLDLDFLGIAFIDEHWNWNLGAFPTLSTGLPATTAQISCDVKLDEPLDASTPDITDGDVKISLSDGSGISDAYLFYSTDKVSWQQIQMNYDGTSYEVKPIDSVEAPTTVYYYVEATDGDDDKYRIDNNGLYFNYNLEPKSVDIFDWLTDLTPNSSNPLGFILMLVATAIVLGLVVVIIRRRRRKQSPVT